MKRPDLTDSSPDVKKYIEFLEEQLANAAQSSAGRSRAAAPVEPSEPPTTLNVITVSQLGIAKRTPRHLYGRQRRGGMGVFDLDVAEPDFPAMVTVADEEADVLLWTNLGRVYRLPVRQIEETAVRAKGSTLMTQFKFLPNEKVVSILPADAGVYVVLVSERGWVQRIRSSYFGRSLIPGMRFHDPDQGGFITSACWTRGEQNVFIGTKLGKGIRFHETQILPKHGTLGLRVDEGDVTVGVTAVDEDGGIFLLNQDGKGTIRLMSGFRMNKAPGAGGKVAMKADNMVTSTAVSAQDDIFIISKTGKIIRFQTHEIPAKEGVVQGVHCISLRNDTATAAAGKT